VPISGSWTGFPSDHLGMTVEVKVTAEADARKGAAGETAPPERRSQASG